MELHKIPYQQERSSYCTLRTNWKDREHWEGNRDQIIKKLEALLNYDIEEKTKIDNKFKENAKVLLKQLADKLNQIAKDESIGGWEELKVD